MPEPYLTIVAATRNDDHGGGMLDRMQVFVDALVAQCDRHRLDAELILVEWNPPPDRAPLVDAIRWPRGEGHLGVRIIQVPPELHARFAHSAALPLFQMIAKNVGIRRARAPFVLATNVDLLFSDGVMRTLSSRQLSERTVYRVDRHDVPADVPRGATVEEQLRWCSEHVLRVNSRRGTKDLRTGDVYPIYSGLVDLPRYLWYHTRHPASIGSPLLAGALDIRRGDFLQRARRVTRRRVLRHRIEARRRARLRAQRPPTSSIPLGEMRHRAAERIDQLRKTVVRARIRPHTNACGDFTLLARRDWHALRGYPELEMYSLHIDSLLLYMSRHAGMRERVLRDPVFHLDHDRGFKPGDEGRRDLFAWLEAAGIPWITNSRFADFVVQMAETRRPLELNDDDWGLGAEVLPEQTVLP